jgi:hypothetical protein
MKYLILVIYILFGYLMGFADEEIASHPYLIQSINGKYYFKMVPTKGKYIGDRKGIGYAYEISADSCDKILWKVSDWYSFKTFLSHDGVYLIRLGNWPRGNKPSKEDLAIAFYKNGKLLKPYSTLEIITDENNIGKTKSHYKYMKGDAGFIQPYEYKFEITTIDNYVYVFNAKTGKQISKKKKE